MKRIVLPTWFLLSLCSLAHGATIGPYVGVGIGKSSARTPNEAAFNLNGFAGYNITPYFGLEVGYANYARTVYNGRIPGAHSEFQYNFRSADAVGKAYLPLGYTGYNLYALAGVVRVTETLNYTNAAGLPLSGSIASPAGLGVTNAYKTRPIYGIGVNFSVPSYHFTINIEATQVDRTSNFGSNPVAVPYLNLVTLGVAYNVC
jgi:hypothetical protein